MTAVSILAFKCTQTSVPFLYRKNDLFGGPGDGEGVGVLVGGGGWGE